MNFLGSFDINEDIIVRVAWTPADPEESVAASTVTAVHATSGEEVGPLAGEETDPNAFEAVLSLPSSGRWKVEWLTVPPGGRDVSTLYVE